MGAAAVEYLKQTKRNLKKRGWHKGARSAYDGGPCSIDGARPLFPATHDYMLEEAREALAAGYLLDDLAGGFGYARRRRRSTQAPWTKYVRTWDVNRFNDHPDTTLDDVNAFLDLAIFIAKDL